MLRLRIESSDRPCTSWSSCTVNSTSRRPPLPSLTWRSASAAGTCASTRRRIACESSTKFSRPAADHTNGAIASSYARPSSRSPATVRALSSAWNSHVLAQRS
ncbi:Uncharacterised protein [Mycobacteroides abscessus]|nr:Uncharacterised protein [Mycobacteroides abscessus]